MTVLALDIGEKNIGLAVSDSSEILALPLKVLDARKWDTFCDELTKIIQNYKISSIVSGMPLTLKGEFGMAAEKTIKKINELSKKFDIPIFYQDERFSSLAAFKALSYDTHKPNHKTKKNKNKKMKNIDSLAASYFLQAYLDKKNK
jgi:putative Holliday junction resolvase